jgi:hypothetical protein
MRIPLKRGPALARDLDFPARLQSRDEARGQRRLAEAQLQTCVSSRPIQILKLDPEQEIAGSPVQPDDSASRHAALGSQELAAVLQSALQDGANGIAYRGPHQIHFRHFQLQCQAGGNFNLCGRARRGEFR